MAPKKRKQESCSPDANDTSRPIEWKPVVQQFLDILGSIHEELRGIAQVKSTVEVLADKLPKLDENVENIVKKIKEDLKKEIKEVVKFELEGNIRKSDGVQLDNQKNQSKVVSDDYAKAPDCSDASPYLRSQPHQSQTPRFRLHINSPMSSVSYKGKDVLTDDGSGKIEVEMRDGDNPIAHDHPLASAKVNLVLVDSELYHGISNKKLWSVEDFRKTLWNPENTKLLKNDTFRLDGGRGIQPKVIITQGTVRKEIRLGVMVEGLALERVLEGVSNPFKVQEAKTAKTATTGTGKGCIPLGHALCRNDQTYLPRQILSQPMQQVPDSRECEGSATHHATKDFARHNGENLQVPQCKIEDQHVERVPHFYDAQSSEQQGHGQISGQQTMVAQRFTMPNRSQTVQFGNNTIIQPQQPYTNPRATSQQHHHGSARDGQVSGSYGQHYQQGQGHVSSSQGHTLVPSLLPATNSQIVGIGRGGPFALRRSEKQIDTSYQQGNIGQRQVLPELSSTEAVKHGVQSQLNPHQYPNFQQKTLFSATSAHPIMGQGQILPQRPTSTEVAKHAGQGQLNSHQLNSFQQKSLFLATNSESMHLDISLNTSQNMPYSSTSQISAPQRDSLFLPPTQIGENGNSGNSQHQFQHGQPKLLLDTRKDEVISVGGQGQVVSSLHDILPPSSVQAVNVQIVGQEENLKQAQRQMLPQHTSTGGVKPAGQGELNSQNLLAEKPAQTRDLPVWLNSTQNMPYSSVSQINAMPRNSWSLPHTRIGENGEEESFQQVQSQILPRITSTEALKHASQGHLSSQKLIQTMASETMDLDIRLNSSQNMPNSSTAQINEPPGDSWSLPHAQIGDNGQYENSQQQLQHGQPKILRETLQDGLISGQGQVFSNLHDTLPHGSLQSINTRSVGEEENFQQVQRQIMVQHISIEAMKHAGQGQLNSQNIFPAIPVRSMDLDINLNSSQTMPYSSTPQNNAPQVDTWSLPQTQVGINAGQDPLISHQHHSLEEKNLFMTTHAEPMGQEENFQRVQRQIPPHHTSTEAVGHGQGQQFNSQNSLPEMPRQTMDLATRLNSSQNRPNCLDALASQVNPPQNSSQLDINNSSGPTEENYESSLRTWQDSSAFLKQQDSSVVYTPNFYPECNENQEQFMPDSCAGEWDL